MEFRKIRMRLMIVKMKLFRFFLVILCKVFRYGGVIYNVTWRVEFGDLIESDKRIIAMNNTIKAHNIKAHLRPLQKGDQILDQTEKGGL